MTKKIDLNQLMQLQISLDQRYPFDNETYLKVLNSVTEVAPLSEFKCSKTTCILGSKVINQHLARLINEKYNGKSEVFKDFAQEFVNAYNRLNKNNKNIIKSILEKKGEAVTILWTFMPYVYDKLITKHQYNSKQATNLVIKWIEYTYYLNKVRSGKILSVLDAVPLARIKMGYYLSANTKDITHSFTDQESNYLAEKIINKLN